MQTHDAILLCAFFIPFLIVTLFSLRKVYRNQKIKLKRDEVTRVAHQLLLKRAREQKIRDPKVTECWERLVAQIEAHVWFDISLLLPLLEKTSCGWDEFHVDFCDEAGGSSDFVTIVHPLWLQPSRCDAALFLRELRKLLENVNGAN